MDELAGKVSAASGAEAPVTAAGFQMLREVFAGPRAFFRRFGRARTIAEQDTCSLRLLTRESLAQFTQGLQGLAEAAAAEFLTILHVFEADDEVQDLAASGKPFNLYFGQTEEEEPDGSETPLLSAYREFKQAITEAPVGADERDNEDDRFVVVIGDEESEVKAKLGQTLICARRAKQKIIALRDWQTNPWAEGGEASAIYQKSKFSSAAAASGAELGNQNSVLIFLPELFPCKEVFQSADAFKEPTTFRKEMLEAYRWMMAKREDGETDDP